ncbi:L-threonylcarbamoyladenylate synthase [Agaribacter marinus]|uniref:Threonylcarbamoyl-AMP synthase n=1 Tax=Agaribacter marinus TaxID=1431249 RepID=A0AA37WJZ0_9ALTE|nr:L-threonylcarbamoyladenylate synthase [Agaribacter marinus]GLR72812.1 threonylcarbamoyl-AMP synthase [Agaribacter marinus]
MPFDPIVFRQQFADGNVFAYPTEAVYGLGCDPKNEKAMDHILSLKQRPAEKGVILIAANIEQIAPFVDLSALSDDAKKQMQAHWPGPYTYLVPKTKHTPSWVSGESDLVAVRVTQHALVCKMCLSVDSPLISTSANHAGKPPAKSIEEVQQYFGQAAVIIDGNLGSQSKPSTIINALTLETLR